jgi:hypothetical protein
LQRIFLFRHNAQELNMVSFGHSDGVTERTHIAGLLRLRLKSVIVS